MQIPHKTGHFIGFLAMPLFLSIAFSTIYGWSKEEIALDGTFFLTFLGLKVLSFGQMGLNSQSRFSKYWHVV
jgi:hypothetical protein